MSIEMRSNEYPIDLSLADFLMFMSQEDVKKLDSNLILDQTNGLWHLRGLNEDEPANTGLSILNNEKFTKIDGRGQNKAIGDLSHVALDVLKAIRDEAVKEHISERVIQLFNEAIRKAEEKEHKAIEPKVKVSPEREREIENKEKAVTPSPASLKQIKSQKTRSAANPILNLKKIDRSDLEKGASSIKDFCDDCKKNKISEADSLGKNFVLLYDNENNDFYLEKASFPKQSFTAQLKEFLNLDPYKQHLALKKLQSNLSQMSPAGIGRLFELLQKKKPSPLNRLKEKFPKENLKEVDPSMQKKVEKEIFLELTGFQKFVDVVWRALCQKLNINEELVPLSWSNHGKKERALSEEQYEGKDSRLYQAASNFLTISDVRSRISDGINKLQTAKKKDKTDNKTTNKVDYTKIAKNIETIEHIDDELFTELVNYLKDQE